MKTPQHVLDKTRQERDLKKLRIKFEQYLRKLGYEPFKTVSHLPLIEANSLKVQTMVKGKVNPNHFSFTQNKFSNTLVALYSGDFNKMDN